MQSGTKLRECVLIPTVTTACLVIYLSCGVQAPSSANEPATSVAERVEGVLVVSMSRGPIDFEKGIMNMSMEVTLSSSDGKQYGIVLRETSKLSLGPPHPELDGVMMPAPKSLGNVVLHPGSTYVALGKISEPPSTASGTVEKIIEVESLEFLHAPPYNADDALRRAVSLDDASAARQAIERGADLRRLSESGDSLLNVAASNGSKQVLAI